MSISEVIQDAKSYYAIVTRSNSSSQLSHLKNCLRQQQSFTTDRVIYPQFQTFNIYSSQSLYNAFQFKYSRKIGRITTISFRFKMHYVQLIWEQQIKVKEGIGVQQEAGRVTHSLMLG